LDEPETIVPAHQVWAFIGSAAEREGVDDFGLQAGSASIEAFGDFSHRLLQASNLNQGLKLFCQLARCEYSRADFYVSAKPASVWFCRGPIDGSDVEKKHVELLVLTMMIATVRLIAGPDWRPPEIFVQTRDSRGVYGHESLLASDLHFGNRITAFEIHCYLLPRQMSPVAVPPSWSDYDRLDDDVVGALRHVIACLPADRDQDITHVAQTVGMSPRTLQRRLSEANTTFSALLEDVRMTTAMAMLADSSVKLRDIALLLRYSDQANFTRAFRRWTGVSPRAYRRQQLTSLEEKTE